MENIALIKASSLFQALESQHGPLEVWGHDTEDGWTYHSVVQPLENASYRVLAYLRIKSDIIQKRTYDEAGDDLWVQV